MKEKQKIPLKKSKKGRRSRSVEHGIKSTTKSPFSIIRGIVEGTVYQELQELD
jgi:hypothetical protein